MKEIVFSPVVHANLLLAQHIGEREIPEGLLLKNVLDEPGNIDEVEEHDNKMIETWNNARPIGGNADDIIHFEFGLEYGDVSEFVPAEKRYESLYELISIMYPVDYHDSLAADWVDNLKISNTKYLNILDEIIDSGEKIRVWYSDAPSEANSFYWLMNYLDSKKCHNEIHTMYLPHNYWNGEFFCRNWGHLSPEHYYDTFSLEKTLTKEQINLYSERWDKLRKENTPLRLMVGGTLVSLEDSFLDQFILKELAKLPDTFRISELVGIVMGEYGFMLGDLVIFTRVKRMIDKAMLMVLEDWKKNPMNTRVSKSDMFING